MSKTGAVIPVAKPWLGEREAEAARRAILSGWVTQGPEVAAFEREFAGAVGARHACAVSNCTTALHLALLSLGVGRGDQVITVSHSFLATASSIRYCGAMPVFVDITPSTFNIDPAGIEASINPRTKAILAVHQMGMPCDLEAVLEIGRRYSIPVVEDAACATGSEILWGGAWEKIGKPHGAIACFSFHPRKLVTTGDGGMLTTSNPDLDAKFRLWRQHSMSVPDTVRHGSSSVILESYPEIGFNYRMTDIQAAVGREQLKRLPEIIQRRRYLADRYRSALNGLDVTAPQEPANSRSNWQSFCVRLPGEVDQRTVMQFLLECGVSTRRGIMCAHREPAYRKGAGWLCGGELLESESAQDHSVILPLYHEMSEEQQDEVVAALRAALTTRAGSSAESRPERPKPSSTAAGIQTQAHADTVCRSTAPAF